VRAADEEQYVEYVTARLPGWRRTAYLLCGDVHRADDVVQATITKLFLHWRRAREAENLDGYVHTILVRSFISEQRLSWARRIRLVGRPQDGPAPPPAAAPDLETSAVLHAALATVPPRQRAVLVLRFLCDLSVAEVAAILHCAPGTVTSQTALGLTALRRRLGDRAMAGLGEG
jgi:RNA polymerase sigma-70 factor (sigma-E family)